MKVNSESIVKTRPWKIFGEGPIANADVKINAQGFNDGQYTKAGSDEIRFTQGPASGKTEGALYVTALAWPENHTMKIKSLADGSDLYPTPIKSVELLGYGKVKFERTKEALIVTLPEKTNNIMPVLKIKK
jgi:alpha-L-fucosidase